MGNCKWDIHHLSVFVGSKSGAQGNKLVLQALLSSSCSVNRTRQEAQPSEPERS